MSPKLKTILVISAVFALGAVSGGAGTYTAVQKDLEHKFKGPPGKSRHKFRMESMSRRLDLTPDQRSQIEAIFAKRHEEMDAAREKCAPQMKELREKTDAEIRTLLRPNQQQKFDAYLEERKKRRRERGKRRRRPPPPP